MKLDHLQCQSERFLCFSVFQLAIHAPKIFARMNENQFNKLVLETIKGTPTPKNKKFQQIQQQQQH